MKKSNTKISLRSLTAFGAIAVASMMAGSVARAQSGTGQSEAAVPQDGAIGDIIVTAQRVSESVQRAAVPLSVISAEDITRQNITRAADLSRSVPSLTTFSAGGPLTSLFIRGVGSTTNNGYVDGGVSFAIDGVFLGRPSGTSGVFYDLQRVEVLKGPQGTLYGRNATGGAINVLPNKPQPGKTGVEFVASYGNYQAVNLEAAVNLAVGENSAFRFSGMYANHDGYSDDGTNDQNDVAFRAQFATKLGETVDLRISGDYYHQGGVGAGASYRGVLHFNPGIFGYDYVPANFSPSNGNLSPASEAYLQQQFLPQAGRTAEALGTKPHNDSKFYGVHAELNWTSDAGTLTVLPAYRASKVDTEFSGGLFRSAINVEDSHQTSVEGRWNGKIGERLDYLIGGLYFDEKVSSTKDSYNQMTVTAYNPFEITTKSAAAFGRVNFEVLDGLKLTLGGRYTRDKKAFAGQSDVYILFCGDPAPPQNFCPNLPLQPRLETGAEMSAFYAGLGVPTTPVPLFVLPPIAGGSTTAPFLLSSTIPINASQTTKKFTYRLAAQYDIAPASMLYASYETGFHSGGFSYARGVETYKPETINAFTLGAKNRFLNNRFQVNLEAFLWKYKGQQFSQFGFDLGTPPTTVFLTRNIGRSTIKGFDLDLVARPTSGLTLAANLQYVHSRYDSFVYYEPNQGLPPVTACAFSPTTQNGNAVYAIDCSGKPSRNSPDWTLYLSASQVVPIGDYELTLQANTRYRSSTPVSPSYLSIMTARANWVHDASVTFGPSSHNWFASAFVNNLSNSRRLTVSDVTVSSIVYGGYESPRTYGLRVGGKF